LQSVRKPTFNCLIANDDSMQLECLKIIFQKNDFKVWTAINGHEAFEIFKDPQVKFDLVVLDLNMPISDGYEACENIIKYFTNESIFNVPQAGAKLKANPIMVACSSYVTPHIILKTSAAGFSLTLETPLTVPILQEKIMPMLELRSFEHQLKSEFKE
jgi:CheY-like chemotaxis protein